jgi:hypothetical protein
MTDAVAKSDLDFRDRDALEAWLNPQPREVSVIIAARAALRVLPLAARELSAKYPVGFAALMSALFRATAVARIAGKYPNRANELNAHANIFVFKAVSGDGAFAARAAIEAAYSANAANAAARAALYAAAAARAAFATNAWAALSMDASFLRQGGTIAELADHPLWPDGTPSWAYDHWLKMIAALPLGEDWEVWNGWYDERLFKIRSRSEAYELVFATVPVEVWNQGHAAANRWIKGHLPPEPQAAPRPQPTVKPLENVPSVFAFGWSASHKITVVAGPQNLPAFPYAGSEADHKQWLETCRTLTERLLDYMQANRLNLRPDYRESLEQYEADLPTAPGQGNFMLAEHEARHLRALFEAEVDLIPAPFASRLRVLLQQHVALRGFYPEVERFYDAVQKSRIEKPLPWDNVEGFARTIRENTPDKFEPEVSGGLQKIESEQPVVAPEDVPHDPKAIQPPPDPLGEVKPEDSRSYGVASFVNGVMKVVMKGKEAGQILDGWEHVTHKLAEDAAPIIDWLHKLPLN